MGMIDQIIDFNKTSGTTRMEEYVPTLSRDCHDVPLLAKKKTPPQSDVFFWVPGRTRTVDIQNHKQTCECLINPVFIGVSAIFDFLFAAILRLFTQGPILFQ